MNIRKIIEGQKNIMNCDLKLILTLDFISNLYKLLFKKEYQHLKKYFQLLKDLARNFLLIYLK